MLLETCFFASIEVFQKSKKADAEISWLTSYFNIFVTPLLKVRSIRRHWNNVKIYHYMTNCFL